MLDDIVTAIGASKPTLIYGAAGAAVAAVITPGGVWYRLTLALASYACAVFGSQIVIQGLDVSKSAEYSVVFFMAAVGIAVMAALLAAITRILSKLDLPIIIDLVKSFFGKS